MRQTLFPRYAILLDRFGFNQHGETTACHTVYGYYEADAEPTSERRAHLYYSMLRKPVGLTPRRDAWADDALIKAGVVQRLVQRKIIGTREDGKMWIVYDLIR